MSDDSKKPQKNDNKKSADPAPILIGGLMLTAALGLGGALIFGTRGDFNNNAQPKNSNTPTPKSGPKGNTDGLTELSKGPKKGPFGK